LPPGPKQGWRIGVDSDRQRGSFAHVGVVRRTRDPQRSTDIVDAVCPVAMQLLGEHQPRIARRQRRTPAFEPTGTRSSQARLGSLLDQAALELGEGVKLKAEILVVRADAGVTYRASLSHLLCPSIRVERRRKKANWGRSADYHVRARNGSAGRAVVSWHVARQNRRFESGTGGLPAAHVGKRSFFGMSEKTGDLMTHAEARQDRRTCRGRSRR